jgi:AhpD family alkylhydroperoxidase
MDLGTIPGKHLYSVRESYRILYDGLRTIRYLARAWWKNELSRDFIERIMLAVTGVNRCPVCSHGHAKMALEAGMSADEIRDLLAGIMDAVPAGELPAVLFAQHYADSRARPSREAWERVVELYGLSRALGILGAIRMIMVGNSYGIPLGSFVDRFRGRPDPRSSLSYELGMMVAVVLFVPVALVHALVSWHSGAPVIRFGTNRSGTTAGKTG